MRIAVASDDGREVAMHTGRCRGFAIFDVEQGQATPVEFRNNLFTAHAQGDCHGRHQPGREHHTHGPLVEALSDCGVLVTRGLGPRLVADLAAEGIDAYLCDVESVQEAAGLYAAGRLVRVPNRCQCGH